MIMVRVAAAPVEDAVRPLRVAIVADLLDERWPSMDLVADMLMVHAGSGASAVSPVLMRPTFPPVLRQGGSQPPTSERIFHRFWSYPRWLRTQPPADVYHIVDHSYAHLAAALPPGRAVITCHDTDAFRALLATGERESSLPRFFVKRVLAGLRRAAVVACVSEHTRQELLAHALVEPARLVVAPNGVHPSCTPNPDAAADDDAMELTGPVGGADLLHVGSTIPRKRIDVLLEVLAAVAHRRPSTRLWRVGGAFTDQQRARARELGVEHLITVLPFVSRPVLAALYRRASLVVLTSEREGFGLPVIEAMACGAPVVCTDLPVLREVGGEAAEYCAIAEIDAWTQRILALLAERDARSDAWAARRARALEHARRFTWAGNASAMQRVYARVATEASVTT